MTIILCVVLIWVFMLLLGRVMGMHLFIFIFGLVYVIALICMGRRRIMLSCGWVCGRGLLVSCGWVSSVGLLVSRCRISTVGLLVSRGRVGLLVSRCRMSIVGLLVSCGRMSSVWLLVSCGRMPGGGGSSGWPVMSVHGRHFQLINKLSTSGLRDLDRLSFLHSIVLNVNFGLVVFEDILAQAPEASDINSP
jgi:hypothetical protein